MQQLQYNCCRSLISKKNSIIFGNAWFEGMSNAFKNIQLGRSKHYFKNFKNLKSLKMRIFWNLLKN